MTMRTYGEISEASQEAKRDYTKHALEILASLEAIDRDLVDDALDLWAGNREGVAVFLMQPNPALAKATCYEALAAGKRDRVLQLINAIRYGIFL